MSDEMIDVVNTFGFDPESVGMRHRVWWIEGDADDDPEYTSGYLYVRTRDPGGGYFDIDAMKKDNFVDLKIDDFDYTYCTYVFSPLSEVV